VINPQELLGSGQFGQVYSGICKLNNQPVAIKVIDKSRFKDFQAETNIFQNEITILYNFQHPGIVRLFALFDEVDSVNLRFKLLL
jgi:serine/threonine protein kinase